MTRRDVEGSEWRSADVPRRGAGEDDGSCSVRLRRLADPRLRRRILARLDALLAARK